MSLKGKRDQRGEKTHMLPVRCNAVDALRHQLGSELPGSPEEKGDIMNSIVFIIRKIHPSHV